MSIDFKQKAELHNHRLKQTRMVFDCSITANATPASKTHVVEVPNCVYLRTQGKTADADAVEDLSAQVSGAATDSTGVFAILIDEQASKVHKVLVTPSAGTITSSIAVTTGGRMMINLDSNQDLSSTNLSLVVEVEYKTK